MADVNTMWCHLREGKRMRLWSVPLAMEGVGSNFALAQRKSSALELAADTRSFVLRVTASLRVLCVIVQSHSSVGTKLL